MLLKSILFSYSKKLSPTIYNPVPFSSLLNIKDSVLCSRTPQNATLYSGTLRDSAKVISETVVSFRDAMVG